MADSTLKIDLPALIKGMDQINLEKREIKLMLDFLKSTISSILKDDPRIDDVTIFQMEIASVSCPEASLSLKATRSSVRSGMLSSLTFRLHGKRLGTTIMLGDSVEVECISSGSVDLCHTLVHRLAEHLLNRRPETRAPSEISHAAARNDR